MTMHQPVYRQEHLVCAFSLGTLARKRFVVMYMYEDSIALLRLMRSSCVMAVSLKDCTV